MKFEIYGDIPKIKEILDEIVVIFNKEYEKIYDNKMLKLTKKIGKYMPVRSDIEIPTIVFGYYENKEKTGFVLASTEYVPKPLRLKRFKKKMIKGLQGIFETANIDVEIEFIGWESTAEKGNLNDENKFKIAFKKLKKFFR